MHQRAEEIRVFESKKKNWDFFKCIGSHLHAVPANWMVGWLV